MKDWKLVKEYAENAKGIAFDTCHKIYVLMDDEQVAKMRELNYKEIHTAEYNKPTDLYRYLRRWFEASCPLRFIEAVETNNENPNAGFYTLIGQMD